MESFKILQEFAKNPTLITFGGIVVVILCYIVPRWSLIEEYFSYRFLKKYENYINVTTDSDLKELLNKKRDQEVLFKLTGIRQVDLAKKIMKLQVHPSLVLYKRDLNFYKYYFALDEGNLVLKEIPKWIKVGNAMNRIFAFLILVIFAIFFVNTIFSLFDIKNVISNSLSIIVSAGMSVSSFILLLGLSSDLYINNGKK